MQIQALVCLELVGGMAGVQGGYHLPPVLQADMPNPQALPLL